MIDRLPPYFDMRWTEENGELTTSSSMFMDESFQTLNDLLIAYNENFSVGLSAPNKTTAEILSLESEASLGTIWFNTTISKLQVKTAPATIETISSA